MYCSKALTNWNDIAVPGRVSSNRDYKNVMLWLDKERPYIGEKAYHCYKGFHVARIASSSNYLKGLYFYLTSILTFKVPLKLAMFGFLQVALSRSAYRKLANLYISKSKKNESRSL